MSGSSLSPSATATLSVRQAAPHFSPGLTTIIRQPSGGKEKLQTVSYERAEAHEQAATTTKQKTRQIPPSLTTVIKPFQKRSPYQGFLASLPRVGHHLPLSFTSVLVLTNPICT